MKSDSTKEELKIYTDERSPRLFKSKFLEALTRTHPLVIDAMYAIMAFFMIRYYSMHYSSDALWITGLFFMGFFSWSLAEYILHRFLYHKIEDASYTSGFQYLFHGVHHEYPNDKSRVVLPPVPSLLIATVIFSVFFLLMGEHAFVFASGFSIGYVAYMNVHYIVHAKPAPKYFNFWWKHHNIHHFQQHDRAFGVTSPIWDFVFRTMPEPGRRNKYQVEPRSRKKGVTMPHRRRA